MRVFEKVASCFAYKSPTLKDHQMPRQLKGNHGIPLHKSGNYCFQGNRSKYLLQQYVKPYCMSTVKLVGRGELTLA